MTENFGRVGVLYGGCSAEREVSLMSGQGVYAALKGAGVDAYLFDTGKQNLAELLSARFDRVFIALHGRYGEDGTVQGALELMRLPYTGSGPLASSLAMDKIMTKKVWIAQGLPTPKFAVLAGEHDLAGAMADLGLPLIIKPPHEGSTLGVTKVNQREEMLAAYRQAATYDAYVLAEQFICGRELTVAILG
ncbi:MAG: D-alanine--D-alanine ligase, partial [Paralcaligenes sp.]